LSGLQTFIVTILGTIFTGVAAVAGVKVSRRGSPRRLRQSEIFRQELAELKASQSVEMAGGKQELATERQERKSEYRQMQAALQSFRDRDGVWFEVWHSQNVALSTAGLPVIQLPERLRRWPEEILNTQRSVE